MPLTQLATAAVTIGPDCHHRTHCRISVFQDYEDDGEMVKHKVFPQLSITSYTPGHSTTMNLTITEEQLADLRRLCTATLNYLDHLDPISPDTPLGEDPR